jgi:hypothetical protein
MNKFRYVLYKEDGTEKVLFESNEFVDFTDAEKEYKRVLMELAKEYDLEDYNNPIELQFLKEEDGNWYFHSTAIDILLYEIKE